MRIRWFNGTLLIRAGTDEEHEMLVKMYDLLEGLKFGRELETGIISDVDDVEPVALDE